MRQSFLRKKKFWFRFLGVVFALPIILLAIALSILYLKQDELIQAEIAALNKGYKGKIEIAETHLKPFANFPYISIKIDHVSILESKDSSAEKLLKVEDIYTGFNIWDILKGNFDIKNLLIENGELNLIFHKDGSLNIQNALQTNKETSGTSPMDIHLKNIQLRNIDLHKLDEATNVDVETFIYYAKGGFQTAGDLINAHIDTEFELNIVDNGDSTYIKRKHFEFHTDLSLNDKTGKLIFEPSGIRMEHGDFDIEGSIDLKNDVNLDLKIKGSKPNFDMLIAFAPQDLIPVLERYKNAGKIYFNAVLTGPTLHGIMPFIDVRFGASEAFLENTKARKRINDMGF
ncbi:MAG: hypothetical protein CBC83_08385, partial [Flavobacteriales bacterium TMED123]